MSEKIKRKYRRRKKRMENAMSILAEIEGIKNIFEKNNKTTANRVEASGKLYKELLAISNNGYIIGLELIENPFLEEGKIGFGGQNDSIQNDK
jgi:hypothetical protein